MADETKDTTTTTEVVYESDAMADIKARIAEQKAAIKAANDAVKELRRAERRQARIDARKAEELARKREEREALEFWRMVHSTTLRHDGKDENAYEFITRKVMSLAIEDEPRQTSDGEDSAHVIEEPLAATMSTCADSESSDGC